jgi:hypothetical protein
MGSNSTKAANEPTFTQFSLLPAELRNQIWENTMFDVEPNVIYASTEVSMIPLAARKTNQVKYIAEQKLRVQCTKPYPIILAVNRESRSIALKTHRPLAPGIPLFLNPTTDLLFLKDSAVIEIFNIAGRQINSSFNLTSAIVAVDLCHVAIGETPFRSPLEFCSRLTSLKTLTLVQSKNRWRSPRDLRGPPTDESSEETLIRTVLLNQWAIQRLSRSLGGLVEPITEERKALITQAGATTTVGYSEELKCQVMNVHMPAASTDTSQTTLRYLNSKTMQGLAEGSVEWPSCDAKQENEAADGLKG